MSYLKKIYRDWCRRIYSTGKSEVENFRDSRAYQFAEIGKDSKIYVGAQIINLANDRSKIKIGHNSHIYGNLTVYPFGGYISIGDHCSLGDISRIVSGNKIQIGSRVMIAHNVNILDNNSHSKHAGDRHEDFVNSYAGDMKEYDLGAKEIIIEDDVWIGFNSIVLKGVRIGRGAIIGAGSLVVKDIEPWTVNVGNPIRCVEKLEPINIK